MSATIFNYDEEVNFTISGVRDLRWCRSSKACSHSQACGERHGDYREERCAQYCEGYQESCAYCGLYLHSVIETVAPCEN